MGVLLLVVGVFIRRRVEETPAFKENQMKAAESAIPQERALAVIVKKPGTVIKLVLSWAASAGLFWISVTYAVNYLTKELGYDNSITFGLLLVANLISIPAAVLGGRLSDRIGRKKTFLLGLTLQGIAAGTMFPIMNTMNYPASVAIIALALCGIQVTAGTQAAFFSESLPTSMRYTGSALGMTLAGLFFGAPIPFIAAWIFQNTENGTVALTSIALSLVADLHHCHLDAARAVQAVAPRGPLTPRVSARRSIAKQPQAPGWIVPGRALRLCCSCWKLFGRTGQDNPPDALVSFCDFELPQRKACVDPDDLLEREPAAVLEPASDMCRLSDETVHVDFGVNDIGKSSFTCRRYQALKEQFVVRPLFYDHITCSWGSERSSALPMKTSCARSAWKVICSASAA